jgi:hypothetical protein
MLSYPVAYSSHMSQGCYNAVFEAVESPVTCVKTLLLRSCCMAAYSPSETISLLIVSQMVVQQIKQNVNHHM